MATEEVRNAVLILARAVALAAGLGLLISGVGDLGLLIDQGLWQGLSRGGFAVFKIVIGAFLTATSIRPNIVYPRTRKKAAFGSKEGPRA